MAAKFLDSNDGKTLSVTLNVGVTMLSLKDRYVKSIGRQEAMRRMENVTLNVNGVTTTATHIFIELATYKGVNMMLRVNKATGFSTVVGGLVGDEY